MAKVVIWLVLPFAFAVWMVHAYGREPHAKRADLPTRIAAAS